MFGLSCVYNEMLHWSSCMQLASQKSLLIASPLSFMAPAGDSIIDPAMLKGNSGKKGNWLGVVQSYISLVV